ncbi:inactive hydroxysteroid dehydrogenase-like protein 1 [Anthonomus grandis grandis]|uniref:inactive hydroxysteroid dehydrogenase-like protein 1 n=1 Tax=Anthonomus grandis grandis TaxID=2921223 RepID=UPI002165D210|nr:inactive hydroxysteroid dehydrogenase-like protein 1 [Anthonomus grandis grandis]XP_050302925.1 inactive hydroxysteroid dehydrogenase-like protein 1 [Anthonomus grandis grandis]
MNLCSLPIWGLALIGMLTIFVYFMDIIWTLLQFSRAMLAPLFLPNEENSLVKKYGPWALVTGSTDGIGRSYAFQLAKQGINVVLVSRSLEKLTKTQKEIESNYPVKTKIIQADFSLGKKAVDLVKEKLEKLQVGILVNNVGKQYEYPMYLAEVPEEELWDIIKINVGATTLMCRAFIGEMKNMGRGAIVNISSGSELQPLPLMSVYAASKTYIKNFTKALRYEYSSFGITVQHLAPMFVATKMNHFSDRIHQKSLFVPDPDSYAKYAVSMLGKLDDSSGYWSHGLQTFFTNLPPEWIRMHIGGYMNRIFRKDYLRIKKSDACKN